MTSGLVTQGNGGADPRLVSHRPGGMTASATSISATEASLRSSGFARHTPLGGDSTGRETVPQPVKDRQQFQARQWLAVGGSGRTFTQSFQFFRYWRFSMNRWLVPFWGFVGSFLMPLWVTVGGHLPYLPDTQH